MAVAVDRERAQAFERDGFLSGVRVCSEAKADEIRREFDALEAVEGRERCQIGLLDRHVDQRFVWELATHPAIVACVSAVLGPDVMLLATHFFCKYPEPGNVPGSRPADPRRRRRRGATDERGGTSGCDRAAKFVAWHQDVTYWGLEPPLAVTAWYAVDDSDVENGCMRVIPGTHRTGVRQHGTSERAGNLLSINQEVPVTPDEEAGAVDLVLRAGEISLHHGMLIHGSNPNRSTRRRCGLTLRYVPPFVRHVEENSLRRPWSAILVHGEDRYHHYGDRPAPFP
jgi:non-heme Fe2+,alpha-ketoglutarate-dependent halogenase